jgi:hypothetical protein
LLNLFVRQLDILAIADLRCFRQQYGRNWEYQSEALFFAFGAASLCDTGGTGAFYEVLSMAIK